jgi:hypothetical protein
VRIVRVSGREESENMDGEGSEDVGKIEESKNEEGEGNEYSENVCNRKGCKNVEDGKDVEEVGSERSEWG